MSIYSASKSKLKQLYHVIQKQDDEKRKMNNQQQQEKPIFTQFDFQDSSDSDDPDRDNKTYAHLSQKWADSVDNCIIVSDHNGDKCLVLSNDEEEEEDSGEDEDTDDDTDTIMVISNEKQTCKPETLDDMIKKITEDSDEEFDNIIFSLYKFMNKTEYNEKRDAEIVKLLNYYRES